MFHLYHTIIIINSVYRYIFYSFCLSIVSVLMHESTSKEYFELIYTVSIFDCALKEKELSCLIGGNVTTMENI